MFESSNLRNRHDVARCWARSVDAVSVARPTEGQRRLRVGNAVQQWLDGLAALSTGESVSDSEDGSDEVSQWWCSDVSSVKNQLSLNLLPSSTRAAARWKKKVKLIHKR